MTTTEVVQAFWRAWAIARKDGVSMRDQLQDLTSQMVSGGILYSEAVREFRKQFLQAALAQCRGNQCRAAQLVGVHRNTIGRDLAELNIDVRQFRPSGRKPAASVKGTAKELPLRA